MPRVRGLLSSGFAFLASLVAVVYYNIGLLPAGHAYLKHDNYGRFGLRHVIAEAGNNLVFERKNIDKIIIYFIILIGLALVVLQVVLLCFSVLASPVFAGPWSSIFLNTPVGHNSDQDIAFMVLDNVFGMMQGSGTGSAVGFYDSCISDLLINCIDIRGNVVPSPTAYPLPMHVALHTMFHFYTMGIAMISGVIIIYFVVAIIGETVTSGTPFGQRFNRAWFIPRLIVFFALLAPISVSDNNAGINVAQLIVFSVAKFGSNMATNVWLQFNDNAVGSTSEFLGQSQSLLAEPSLPEIGGLTQFMHVVRMCMVAEKIINGIDVYPYFVRSHSSDTTPVLLHNGSTEPGGAAAMGGTTNDYLPYNVVPNFSDAVVFSRYKDVILRFGHRNPPGMPSNPSGVIGAPADGALQPNNKPDAYDEEWGFVQPTCGELHFEITSLDDYVIEDIGIQDEYLWEIYEFFYNNSMADETVLCMAQAILPYDHDPGCVDVPYNVTGQFDFTSNTGWVTAAAARANIELFNSTSQLFLNDRFYDWGTYSVIGTDTVYNRIRTAYDTSGYESNLLMPTSVRERGWAGAALWYNKIAELNGIVTGAVKNVPRPFKYPMVMEIVAEEHRMNDTNVSYADRFNPRLQNGQLASLSRPGDQYIAAALYNDYNFWRTSHVQETVHTRSSKNVIVDFINAAFGTDGILNILENEGVHPLAMLSSAGKGIVDASIDNLIKGAAGEVAGRILSDDFFGPLASTAGDFLIQMSLLTLSIGFMLYYVLPFMPFIYFFFAFAGWVKSIFEAVVAMPLWAVAHIKIDGEGLPGPWATNGYFLIFEIFLRPTFIIVGLLASISIFSALVAMLHELFHMVTLTATGFDMQQIIFDSASFDSASPTSVLRAGKDGLDYWRSPIDELFYTVIYVIIVYMIGLSCFKLIDQIPNNIMRWMGVTVSTFHETSGDPAGELSSKMYRATQMTNAQITTSIARMKGMDSNAVQDQLLKDMAFGSSPR
ncbi:MAG: DotA/TraY family protein [Alphaproteobacteria bacterium]